MEGVCDYTFEPWRFVDGKVIRGDDWDTPQSWVSCDNCRDHHRRRRVFCCSLADVFEDWQGPIVDHKGERLFKHTEECGYRPRSTSLPSGDKVCGSCGGWCIPVTMDDLRADLFRLIDATPNLDWLLLTKRPENVRRMIEHSAVNFAETASWYRSNLWIGTSVSDQETADTMLDELAKLRDLTPVLFGSFEPLLEHVDASRQLGLGGMTRILDWCIIGGESGRNARPCNVDWIRSLVNQCKEAGVPAFTKQLGARVVDYGTLDDWPDATFVASTKDTDSPVEVVLKHSKGGTMDEWPLNIRVREFPCLEKSGAPS